MLKVISVYVDCNNSAYAYLNKPVTKCMFFKGSVKKSNKTRVFFWFLNNDFPGFP